MSIEWVSVETRLPTEDMQRVKVKGVYPVGVERKTVEQQCFFKIDHPSRPGGFMTSMNVTHWAEITERTTEVSE